MGKVEKLSICRMCLTGNVRMHVLDTNLKEFYQKLTSVPFDTNDCRPSLACYICYAMLHKCYQFTVKCVNTETMFSGMLNKNCQIMTSKFKKKLKPFYNLKSFIHVDTFKSYLDDCLKEEVSDVEVGHDDGEEDYKSVGDFLEESELKEEVSDSEHDPDPLATDKPSKQGNEPKPSNSLAILENSDKQVEKNYDSVNLQEESPINEVDDEELVEVEGLEENVEVEALDENFEYDQHIESDDSEQSEESGKKRIAGNKQASGKNRKTVNKDSEDEEWTLQTEKRKLSNPKKVKRSKCNTKNCDETEDIGVLRNIRLKDSVRFKYEVVHLRRTHTGEEPYKCNVCPSLRLHNKHMIIPARARYQNCDVCVRGFLEKSTGTYQRCFIEKRFIKHLSNLYRCNKCQRSFTHKRQLITHIISNQACTTKYQCDICPRNYIFKSKLENHIRTHTGEKPFKCDICQRCFRQTANLKRHKMTHTGEKPYMCHICSQLFNQKANLNTHLRNVHGVVQNSEKTTVAKDESEKGDEKSECSEMRDSLD